MVFGVIRNLLRKVSAGLAKTRRVLGDALRGLIGQGRAIDRDFLERLEEILLAADIGVAKTDEILAGLQQRYRDGAIARGDDLLAFLHGSLRAELDPGGEDQLNWAATGPTVVLVVGVNGTGKTTSVAKLAKRFKDQGRRVLLAAGDTYRAAATEQLMIWAERVGVDIVKQCEGADAAAVVYDALRAAIARSADLVLVDTAGRLHNRDDLMRELEKIRNVTRKVIPAAPHEVWLVVDATSGQNAIQQAKVFGTALGITGLILTKLDGTAKGGATVSIKRELGIPVRYIGVGEQMDDLQPFDADTFVAAILGRDPPADG
jgi:fused signal recognition particle receptor